MTIKRRLFNGYMATGLVAGSTIGFVASRFGGTEDKPRELLTPVDALREAAVAAPGVHQIGLAIKNLSKLSVLDLEQLLLSRLGYDGIERLYVEDLIIALDQAIRGDYAQARLTQVGKYVLSETEKMFIGYVLLHTGRDKIAYTPPEIEARDGFIARGVKFGPYFTVAGQIFNEQADGHGALWVQAENTPPGTVITINGKRIKTSWKAKALTGAVDGDELQALIAKPARHEIALFVPETGIRQIIGEMEIKPRPPAATLEDGRPSTVFCEIETWSVETSGEEEQLRISTLCGPRSAAVFVGEVALTTKIWPSSIRAKLERAVLTTGEHPLRLVDTLSGEAVRLGNYKSD